MMQDNPVLDALKRQLKQHKEDETMSESDDLADKKAAMDRMTERMDALDLKVADEQAEELLKAADEEQMPTLPDDIKVVYLLVRRVMIGGFVGTITLGAYASADEAQEHSKKADVELNRLLPCSLHAPARGNKTMKTGRTAEDFLGSIGIDKIIHEVEAIAVGDVMVQPGA